MESRKMYKGIDISEFQGNVDFAKIKNQVDFVIIRVGHTTGKLEPKFLDNVKGCIEHGIDYGLYWACYGKNVQHARDEANFVLGMIKKYDLKPSYPIAIDFEGFTLKDMRDDGITPTKELVTAMLNEFCETIQRGGHYAMIYMDCSTKEQYTYSYLFKKFDLWLAHWNVEKPRYKCGIWQTSSRGRMDGIQGVVDVNTGFKNYPQIMIDYGLNGYGKEQNPTPPSDDPIEDRLQDLEYQVRQLQDDNATLMTLVNSIAEVFVINNKKVGDLDV